MARWNSANVLQTTIGGRRLWRFSAKGDGFAFDQEKTLTLNEPAPPALVGKDWQSLIRRKLNIAWLPSDKVFLRAVQLPGADTTEITAMVELQLEKLSPLPVTHIVWSLHLMPRPPGQTDALQTVIVIIAARAYVEEFLGELQTQGFLADRIEAPGLDQLLAARIESPGIWIFPGAPAEPALIVWHYGGAIRDLNLLSLPPGPERAELLKAHFEQIAWAGELEGWLDGPLRIHLVATPAQAQEWTPLLNPSADQDVEIVAPATPADLAASSARRTAGDGTTNLLPPEFAARYHQQLVDRLWMRGLITVFAMYVIGVLGYFAFLYELKHQYEGARATLATVGVMSTNAQQDEIQINILKERQALKYAVLDCWKSVAENLPESMTLDTFYFTSKKLVLNGTGQAEQSDDIASFNEALRKAGDAGHALLFEDVSPPKETVHGNRVDWAFTCLLRNTEAP